MATREIIRYRTCDKCAPKEVRAAVTDKLIFNGSKYEIDLCDKHSLELFSAMMAWADLGTKTGESKLDSQQLAREVKVNLDPPKFPLSRAAEPELEPAAATPVAPVTPLRAVLADDPALPLTASRWRLTTHAEQRRVLRELTLAEVLWACERPEVTAPSKVTTGAFCRTRGRCTAVVDPLTHAVITVLTSDEAEAPLERKAQG